MTLWERYVIRNGDWVEATERTDIKDGELCIEESDGYGCFMYKLTLMPPQDNGHVCINDTDESGAKEKQFNEFLASKRLPKFFKRGDE